MFTPSEIIFSITTACNMHCPHCFVNREPFNLKASDAITFLKSVYDSLEVKGYDPVSQIVGYIISEDPTYITNYNNARSLICRLDRDELLQELVTYYLAVDRKPTEE
jgi:uncharacterized protein (UPF0297 family)